MYDPLGLSIGTTNLVAAHNGSPPVTRCSVLTLYPHCAPKVGVPDRDASPCEHGVLMKGFVERIGDSVALVSPDGSAHDSELLMVEALDAMVLAAGADVASSEITIAVPAHWKPNTVQALRDGLRTHVGFVRSGMAPRLVSDAITSLTAVNSEIGLPDSGMVGLVDFGGGGTSVTLVNVADDFELASATMRYADFSGNEIDQQLLLWVFEALGRGSGVDPGGTAAVVQFGELREQCRAAKELLSTEPVTEIAAELGDRSARLVLTREELGDLIQDRLSGFIYAFDDMLARNHTSWADLAAVVTVGGGALIPLVSERLSVHGRTSILTPSQPCLAAAAGALMLASRGEVLDLRTRTSVGLLTAAAEVGDVVDLGAGDVLVIDDEALTDRELAWSQTEYPGDVRVRFGGESYDEDGPAGWSMQPNMIDSPRARPWRRLRLSQLVIGMSAVVAMTAIGGVAYTLTGIENRQAPPAPTVAPRPAPVSPLAPRPAPVSPPAPPTAVPVPPPPSAEPVPSPAPPPPPPPPPPPVIVTTPPPPVTTRPPAPPPTTAMTTTPPPPTTTTPPPTTTTPPPPASTTETTETPSTTVPMTTEWIRIPLLPMPIPVPVPANQAPPVPQYPGGGGYSQNPFLGPGY